MGFFEGEGTGGVDFNEDSWAIFPGLSKGLPVLHRGVTRQTPQQARGMKSPEGRILEVDPQETACGRDEGPGAAFCGGALGYVPMVEAFKLHEPVSGRPDFAEIPI